MLSRIKTQRRIVTESVNTLRQLFKDNMIELNEFSIQNDLKVVGYAIPHHAIPSKTLRKVLTDNCQHLVTYSAISAYSKYLYAGKEITITYFDQQTSLSIK